MTRTCSTPACAATLGPNNRTGLCRSCNTRQQNQCPEFQAKRMARLRAVCLTQRGSMHRSRAAKAAAAKRLTDPAYLERLRAHMDRIRPLGQTAEVNERRRVSMSLAVSDARLPWCPREYRQTYRDIRSKGLSVAEARQAVEAQVKADRNRPLTFEEKLAKVLAGEVGISRKVALPTAEYGFSITGGSL